MDHRVFYDQYVIQSDFASIKSNSLFDSPLFQSIGSYFNPKSSWNDRFIYSNDFDNRFGAVLVGHFLYLLNLSTNEYKFIKISDKDVKRNDIAFNNSTETLLVLKDNKINEYSYDLELIKTFDERRIHNTTRLLSTHEDVYALSQNNILSLSTKKNLVNNVLKYKFAISSSKHIVLFHACSFTVVCPKEKQTNIIENREMKGILDASFSFNEIFLYVLDQTGQAFIYEILNDNFTIKKQINSLGAKHLIPWPGDDHVLFSDDFGMLTFVSIQLNESNGESNSENEIPHIQQHVVSPHSVIRRTKDGFLMFEPTNKIGCSVNFILKRFVSISPREIYSRNCFEGLFGDALQIIHHFPNQFDNDLYHKSFLRANLCGPNGQEVNSMRLIDENLKKIRDKDWVFNFCLSHNGSTFELSSDLIEIALNLKPTSMVAHQISERLKLYMNFLKDKGEFNSKDWGKFKNCSLLDMLCRWAKKSLFAKIEIVFKESSEIDEDSKLMVISGISPFEPPKRYRNLLLMVNDPSWFIRRAIEIDEITGQSSAVIELLTIGDQIFITNPYLKEVLILAIEYDKLVIEVWQDAKSDTFSFQDYLDMSDGERLLRFVSNIFPKAISDDVSWASFNPDFDLCLDVNSFINLINGYAKSIISRSDYGALSYVFCLSLSKEFLSVNSQFDGNVYANKLKSIAQILKIVPTEKAKIIVDQIMSQYNISLTKEIAVTISKHLKPFLSEENVLLIMFAIVALKYIKNSDIISFKWLKKSLTVDFVISIAVSVSKDPNHSIWANFYDILLDINQFFLKSTVLANKLYEIDLRMKLILSDFDSIEIQSENDIDTLILYINRLVAQSISCSTDHSCDLNSAQKWFDSIPKSFYQNIKYENALQSLKNHFQWFKLVSILDIKQKPHDLSMIYNKTEFVCNLIAEKLEWNDVLTEKIFDKIISQCKVMGNLIDIQKIRNSFALFCFNNKQIEYGTQFLDDSDDFVRLNYLCHFSKNKKACGKSNTMIDICDNSIKNCEQKLLPDFLAIMYDSLNSNSSEDNFYRICEFILHSKYCDEQINKFAFSFISFEEILKYGKYLIEKNSNDNNIFLNFFRLVKKITELELLDAASIQQLTKFASNEISHFNDSKKQVFKMMKYIESNGFLFDKSQKIEIGTLYYLEKCGFIDEWVYTSIDDVIKLFKQNRTTFETSLKLIKLLKFWKTNKVFSISNAKDVALLVCSKFLIENRDFWTNSLNEEAEMEILETSKIEMFGLTSVYNKVQKKAEFLIKDCLQIDSSLIDYIIEKSIVNQYSDSRHFNTIINKAIKNTSLIRKVFFSLYEAGQKENVLKFLSCAFPIPNGIAISKNYETLSIWAKELLAEKV